MNVSFRTGFLVDHKYSLRKSYIIVLLFFGLFIFNSWNARCSDMHSQSIIEPGRILILPLPDFKGNNKIMLSMKMLLWVAAKIKLGLTHLNTPTCFLQKPCFLMQC